MHDHLAAVAAQAPRRFRGNAWAAFHVAAQARSVFGQGVGIHVDDHLVAFAGGHGGRFVSEGGFGDAQQGVGLAGGVVGGRRISGSACLFGIGFVAQGVAGSFEGLEKEGALFGG